MQQQMMPPSCQLDPSLLMKHQVPPSQQQFHQTAIKSFLENVVPHANQELQKGPSQINTFSNFPIGEWVSSPLVEVFECTLVSWSWVWPWAAKLSHSRLCIILLVEGFLRSIKSNVQNLSVSWRNDILMNLWGVFHLQLLGCSCGERAAAATAHWVSFLDRTFSNESSAEDGTDDAQPSPAKILKSFAIPGSTRLHRSWKAFGCGVKAPAQKLQGHEFQSCPGLEASWWSLSPRPWALCNQDTKMGERMQVLSICVSGRHVWTPLV